MQNGKKAVWEWVALWTIVALSVPQLPAVPGMIMMYAGSGSWQPSWTDITITAVQTGGILVSLAAAILLLLRKPVGVWLGYAGAFLLFASVAIAFVLWRRIRGYGAASNLALDLGTFSMILGLGVPALKGIALFACAQAEYLRRRS